MPILVAVVALVTVVAFEALAITTVMPIVEGELGEIQLYGWVFSSFYMGTLIGVVVGGNAVDRMRPIGPMLAGVGVFVAGLVIGGLAPNMDVLVAGRFVQGLGAGVVPAVSYVVVSRGFPRQLHPSVFAAMSAAWVLPALISPLVASVIGRHFGWRWVFLSLVPVTAVVAAVASPAVARVEEQPAAQGSEGAQGAQLLRVLALTFGATAAIVGFGLERPAVGAPLAVLGIALMVPMFRSPTPRGTLVARPRLPAAILLRGLLTFAYFSSDAFLALGVTSVRGHTTIYAGFALVASSVSWTVGSWLQARSLKQVSDPGLTPSRLVRAGALLVVVGAVGLVASLSDSTPMVLWVLSSSTMGLGMGLAYTTISVVTLGEAEPGREGSASAALQLSDILGVAMGTGIAGVLVAVGARYNDGNAVALASVFALSGVIATASAVIAPRLSSGLGTGASASG